MTTGTHPELTRAERDKFVALLRALANRMVLDQAYPADGDALSAGMMAALSGTLDRAGDYCDDLMPAALRERAKVERAKLEIVRDPEAAVAELNGGE